MGNKYTSRGLSQKEPSRFFFKITSNQSIWHNKQNDVKLGFGVNLLNLTASAVRSGLWPVKNMYLILDFSVTTKSYLFCPKVLHGTASVLACWLWLVLENWGDFHVKSCWLACILSCFHFLAATFADDSARKQLDQRLYEVAFTFFNSSTIKGQLNSQCKPKIIRITKQS